MAMTGQNGPAADLMVSFYNACFEMLTIAWHILVFLFYCLFVCFFYVEHHFYIRLILFKLSSNSMSIKLHDQTSI